MLSQIRMIQDLQFLLFLPLLRLRGLAPTQGPTNFFRKDSTERQICQIEAAAQCGRKRGDMVIGVKGFDLPGRPSTPNPCRVPARGSIAREMNADPSHDAGSLSLTPAPGVVIEEGCLDQRDAGQARDDDRPSLDAGSLSLTAYVV